MPSPIKDGEIVWLERPYDLETEYDRVDGQLVWKSCKAIPLETRASVDGGRTPVAQAA